MWLILRVASDLVPADCDSKQANRDAGESNDFVATNVSKVAEEP